ncbi:MAG: GNAT family N-acetyltransferase [Bryobacteraceae bacterium]|nr:GNAT family N-acetyltransferase [Solibacteraceae bacterium]MCL4844429.1 GNAT family N-acetyltransferase [Bryobacteraceae bacterium]MCO5351928.1 GNAT family N-acetyltransferase [Bryobacteraceae bacterium]
MPAIEVRRARPDEADALLGLIRGLAAYEKLTPPDAAAEARLVRDIFGEKPRLEAFLVFVDGRAGGYALILETYSSFLALPTLYLEDIFVEPDLRGCGAGKALFQAMVREARDRGCGRMEWVVLDWNKPALEFYARHGARPLNDWIPMRLTREQLDSFEGE